jgi:hypothetical protein
MALAAFPLATETQAQLENQPSREAEPVSPLRNRDNSRLETSSQETRKLHAEAEKGGNAPPFLLFLWLMGELHCCAFAELIERLRWLFIMVFADRTEGFQAERLEFGFRDTFLFDRPAKSEASKDKSIHN